jgi:hypothetical protein
MEEVLLLRVVRDRYEPDRTVFEIRARVISGSRQGNAFTRWVTLEWIEGGVEIAKERAFDLAADYGCDVEYPD